MKRSDKIICIALYLILMSLLPMTIIVDALTR